HIHLHQVLGDGRIVYAGAPRPTRFGEEADKGYCIIDVAEGATIEHVKSYYRPLVTVRARMVDGLLVEAESGTPLTDGGGIGKWQDSEA
ncbi:MAG: hypothetical protein GWN84_04990, partial [Gammaproteobacteria bacterium]|nr:hypothetical protein [Gammaproteobacteria bacterium]NIR82329.1 hypothetical protein [Gammaproteobacteria bacterium]NIU03470.1 hypothetical protein [Gammaproteobacteria bacterium]NIV50897.1 hypothetical protein [Gammaproteobacteria bacterium]NIX84745.1 hypothetical protein [Gammaproteobacteria bacterium]